jgi:chemotaxis protein histidine kinase CheA
LSPAPLIYQFGTASLGIHQRTCLKKHQWGLDKLPPRKRVPLPEPPALAAPLSGDAEETFDAFNTDALAIYSEHAKACAYCINQEKLRREEEEAERSRLAAEEDARRAKDAARLAAEAAEAAWSAAEAEEARKRAEEERLRREAEEADRLRREAEERARQEAEERERLRREAAEAERLRREAEERARLEAEEAEHLRREAEEEARQRREAEERARQEAEERERLRREAAEAERLRREAEERARLEAEEAERLRREAEERARREAADAEARRIAAEEAERLRREAEEAEAQRLADEEAERRRRNAKQKTFLRKGEGKTAYDQVAPQRTPCKCIGPGAISSCTSITEAASTYCPHLAPPVPSLGRSHCARALAVRGLLFARSSRPRSGWTESGRKRSRERTSRTFQSSTRGKAASSRPSRGRRHGLAARQWMSPWSISRCARSTGPALSASAHAPANLETHSRSTAHIPPPFVLVSSAVPGCRWMGRLKPPGERRTCKI